MEMRLGRFGDARLEKGGPFYTADLSPIAAKASGSDGLAGVALERCG
jgi:hypothetical protein